MNKGRRARPFIPMFDPLGGEEGRYIIGAFLALMSSSFAAIIFFFMALVFAGVMDEFFGQTAGPPAPAARPVPAGGEAAIARKKTE
jgi:hypothetical protein